MMMLDDPLPADKSPANLLLIMNETILTSLSDQLTRYSEDIIADGGTVEIRPFSSEDSVENLKSLIKKNRSTIDGVFLVGDLPTAWYEQHAFGRNEEFPIDLYLMDLDATWSDSDNDGIYDGHSPLNLSIYVSRMIGSEDEIDNYFTKLHNYRSDNYEYLDGAFIFKDDDWFSTYRGSSFGLERMYDQVRINENAQVTRKENYLYSLSNDGADYVYQWIHSTPTSLYISNDGYYSPIRYADIGSNEIKGRFLNMFNCKGARYTQKNLAMTYLGKTKTGLAVTGSTKVGGNYYPLEFHRALTVGSSWGNAFKSWYNYYGKNNDEWFLGMVILGDPTLYILDSEIDRTLSKASFSGIIPPSSNSIKLLGENLVDFEETL